MTSTQLRFSPYLLCFMAADPSFCLPREIQVALPQSTHEKGSPIVRQTPHAEFARAAAVAKMREYGAAHERLLQVSAEATEHFSEGQIQRLISAAFADDAAPGRGSPLDPAPALGHVRSEGERTS